MKINQQEQWLKSTKSIKWHYLNKYKINKNIIFYANFINHKYLQTKKKNYFEKNIYYLHQILIIIFIILYI